MYQIQKEQDTSSLLSTLAGIIREFHIPVDQYLGQIEEKVMTNPFRSGAPIGRIKIRESMPDHGLIDLFSSCEIIEFADWSGGNDASLLWDELYTDVIKPLKKRDFRFIFHLGDVTGKLVFKIDEILDTIGDYSAYGKVTLMLNSGEAGNLWCTLNGRSPDVEAFGPVSSRAKEKCLSLFNTMSIDSLVVLHDYSVIHLSQDGQFVLAGTPPGGSRDGNTEVRFGDGNAWIRFKDGNARTRFSAGYQLGLLLQLESWQCTALGLAVSGGDAAPTSPLTSSQLLTNLHDWINIL